MKYDNTLFCGDNLEVLREHIPDESIDLVYIDPPFFSNRQYAVIWGDEAERRSFEDTWEGGIESYVSFMDPRIRELWRVLKPDGSIFVHCDWHASHQIRTLLDKIFGANRFLNEIIWYYRGGGVSKNYFGRRHDNIYFYAKSDKINFYVDAVRQPYTDADLGWISSGKYKAYRGSKVYEGYKLNPAGKHPDDVWQIQPINPTAKERLGYPTQKPEKLLEIFVKAASKEGDIVLDCFCGCGTTLAVAQKLNRRWIGVDISYTAVELVKERLGKLAVTPRVIGMPTTVDDALRLKPFDFQTWVLKKLHCYASPRKTADFGIDGFTYFKQYPVQIKKSEHIGRNVIDNFLAAIKRQNKTRGVIIGISFGQGAISEVHRLKNCGEGEITLLTLEEVMHDYRIEE
ncbi:MAG: hypothetical protein FJY65_10140 [Calditrichaeota bacterium]|nr:hypothetical protein [Calditrichota bacterium]